MKIPALFIISLLLVSQPLHSMDFPPVEMPASSEGLAVLKVSKGVVSSPLPWLPGIYLNEDNILGIINTAILPFDTVQLHFQTYNHYGFLIQEGDGQGYSKGGPRNSLQLVQSFLNTYPIDKIFEDSKAKLPADFQEVAWIKVSYQQNPIVRRIIPPPVVH